MTNPSKSSAAYCLTADFCHKSFNMKGFVLSQEDVKGEHTGNSLSEELEGMVAEWELD